MTDNETSKKKKRLVSKAYTNGGFRDETLVNYFKGVYFENGKKVELPKQINKYNNKFISDVSDLNSKFYSIVRAERVMIKLLDIRGKKEHYGDIRNLFNLIYAQSATIRINKNLRLALRTYGITKQKLYNSIKTEIDKEYGRVERNTLLLNNMVVDYGLDGIVDIIKKDTGMSLIEHVKYYCDNLSTIVSTSIDKDDLQEFYDKQTQEYIDYLADLASKYGIDIYTYESESLKLHKEARALLKEKILEDERAYKEQKRREKLEIYIDKDNDNLQHDISTGEDECSLKFINIKVRYEMFKHIKDDLNGVAFYIAAVKQTKIQYVSKDNAITSSVTKMRLFSTYESAASCLEECKNTEAFKNIYTKICKLELTEYLSRQADKRGIQLNNAKLSPKLKSDKAIELLTMLLNSYNFDTRLREDQYAHLRIMYDAIECNKAIPLLNVPFYITVITATFIGGEKHGTVRFLSNKVVDGKKYIELTDYNLGVAVFPNDVDIPTDNIVTTNVECDKLEFRKYKIELQPIWINNALKVLEEKRINLSVLLNANKYMANESRYAEAALKSLKKRIIHSKSCLSTGEVYCVLAAKTGGVSGTRYWSEYFVNIEYKHNIISESPFFLEIFGTYQEAAVKLANAHRELNKGIYSVVLCVAKLDVNPMQLRNDNTDLI